MVTVLPTNKGKHKAHQKKTRMRKKKTKKKKKEREKKRGKRSAQTTSQPEAADSRISRNVDWEATPKCARSTKTG